MVIMLGHNRSLKIPLSFLKAIPKLIPRNLKARITVSINVYENYFYFTNDSPLFPLASDLKVFSRKHVYKKRTLKLGNFILTNGSSSAVLN